MRTRGFTLIEALIALAVMSIGMLALTGLHIGLSRHADLARQRTEATQLAQSRLEDLRSFDRVLAAPGHPSYAELTGGQDVPAIASNTRYERRWTVDGDADAGQRRVEVRVDWTDRSGDDASVRLLSLIARSDPADGGSLGLPLPQGDRFMRPRERALDIPVEATRLDGSNRGRSTLPWSGASGGHLVFDDASGMVTATCAATPGNDTDITASCAPLPAYLLRGHIRGDWLAAVTDITITDAQHLLAVPECHVADAVDHNDGRPIAGLRHYHCLMRAADHDGDPGTPRAWSGRSIVQPAPVAGQSVCRDTPDPATTDNDLHPAVYTLVHRSLHHQNFLLLSAGACPAGTAPHQP